MSRRIVLLVGGLALLHVAPVFSADAVLAQKYGRGVHAYFAGDALKAYEQLTAAIDGGSKDPRAFYFRGLAFLRLGRPQQAASDFQKGADLESRDVNKFYNVSKSLERVQGTTRAQLEDYRVEARMAVLEENERARKARYDAIQSEESRVLREMAKEAPASSPEEVAAPASNNPFAPPAEKAPEKLAEQPAPAAPAPAAEAPAAPAAPAEAPAAPAAPAAAAPPAAAPAEAPAVPAAAPAAAPAADAENPFKDEPPADKPAEAPAAPAAAAEPAETPAPAAEAAAK